MHNSFYLRTKYENIVRVYLYPIWEFFRKRHTELVGVNRW
jgi:hypothetical protein